MIDVYQNMEKKFSRWSPWDICATAILLVALIFQIADWPKMPFSMDCYYHLSVMRGFEDAGGWVGESFWEYAPIGRPHLYPPLFHILEMVLSRLGAGPIFIARFFEFIIYPVFLFAAWSVLRELFSDRLAFFALFFMFSSFALYCSFVLLIPFSLSFLFILFSFRYFEREKWQSSAVCLIFAFYAHGLMAFLYAAALLLYVCLRRNKRLQALGVCLSALLVAAPLLWHQLKYSSFLSSYRAVEFYYVQINLLLILLAVFGFKTVWKRGGRYLFFASFVLIFSFLFFVYRNRFLSGQGIVPLCFLSAAALEDIWLFLVRQPYRIFRLLFFWITAIVIFYFLTPAVETSPFRRHPVFMLEARLPRFRVDEAGFPSPFAQMASFYHPRLITELVHIIQGHSLPEELIYSNFNYATGMLALLSHRATSDAMLMEVGPFLETDGLRQARLVIWFKEPDGGVPPWLSSFVNRHGLHKIAETDLAFVYRNGQAAGRRRIVKSIFSFEAIACVLVFFLLLILRENHSNVRHD